MKIPNTVINNEYQPFPAGTYQGELSTVEDRWANDKETLFIRLTFDKNSPADDNTEDPGNRKFTEDICIRLRGESLFDIEEITGDTPFLFSRSAGLLAGLAMAFGEANKGDDGVDFDVAGFVQDLREGAHESKAARYVVAQRGRKRKDTGDTVVEAHARRFAPVA